MWSWPTFLPWHIHLITITITFLVTWLYSLKGEFLIDDDFGVAKFSDHLDKDGNLVTTYKHKVDDKEVDFKHTQFNPYFVFPFTIIRWLRLNLCKKKKLIGKDKEGKELWGHVQDPFKHHIISLALFYTNLILVYIFISKLLNQEVAFYTVLLFTVYPIASQPVAWISGYGYALSLSCILLTLITSLLDIPIIATLVLIPLFSYIACAGLMTGCFLPIILACLGKYDCSVLSALVGVPFFYKQGNEFISLRFSEFRKQNMSRSTFITWKKIFVVVKTLYYYIKLAIFPRSLGLFHVWGYHYNDELERPNLMFLLGVATLSAIGVAFYYGSNEIRLAIIWFFTFLIPFSNVVTGQQFISDRYIFIPGLAVCFLIAYLLGNTYIYYLILGAFLVRTTSHLPTFRNKIAFYESNFHNFPKSEVSLGNLGVELRNVGYMGWAVDIWRKASEINPDYSVAWYNLHSAFKSGGALELSRDALEKCCKSKLQSFPEMWKEELKQLDNYIASKKGSRLDSIINDYTRGFSCK